MVDDYREAYWWLRDNTPEDARIMAWWDYGYQITGIANRTTIAVSLLTVDLNLAFSVVDLLTYLQYPECFPCRMEILGITNTLLCWVER
jgi:hypothetical protein